MRGRTAKDTAEGSERTSESSGAGRNESGSAWLSDVPASAGAGRPRARPTRPPLDDSSARDDSSGLGRALGMHWLVDAHECRVGELASKEHLERVLLRLCEELRLRRVGPPHLFATRSSGSATDTIAGLVLLTESHLSIHVRPALRTLHADLFSCAPFDQSRALHCLREAYLFDTFEERLIERGNGVRANLGRSEPQREGEGHR